MFSSFAQREEIYICMSRGTTSSPLIPRFNFPQTIRYLCNFFHSSDFPETIMKIEVSSRNERNKIKYSRVDNVKKMCEIRNIYIYKGWSQLFLALILSLNISSTLVYKCFIYCFYSGNNFHLLIWGKIEIITIRIKFQLYGFEFFNLILIKSR